MFSLSSPLPKEPFVGSKVAVAHSVTFTWIIIFTFLPLKFLGSLPALSDPVNISRRRL